MLLDCLQLLRFRHQQGIEAPRLKDWLRKRQTGVAGNRVLIEIAAISDHGVDRQLPIVHDVPQRVARFKETGALDENERSRSAQVKTGGDLPRFTFATSAHEA